MYKNELTSLSAIMQEIKKVKSIAGTMYFTYKQKTLDEIAQNTQWKE